MTDKRQHMVDRMIHIYGFEHPVTLDFARMCDMDWMSDEALETTVRVHEEYPLVGDYEE